MDKDELYEEIRAMLREPLLSTTARPWRYTDDELLVQVKSAARQIRARGVTTTLEIASDGSFTTDPEEMEGLLIAYLVAERLLSGDTMQKLLDGELGVLFKAGSDTIDTKGAVRSIEMGAKQYRTEFENLLTIALANGSAGGTIWTGTSVETDAGTLES